MKKIWLLFLLLAPVFLSAQTTLYLSGTVTSNGSAAAGHSLDIYWPNGISTVLTDANGHYSDSLTTILAPGQNYVAVFTLDCYNNWQGDTVIYTTSNTSFVVDFALCPNGTLCQAAFSTQMMANGNVNFQSQSIGGSPNTMKVLTWIFGDGSSATTISPNNNIQHTYTANGSYTACLIYLDSLSACFDTVCHTVTVTNAGTGNCMASFTSSVNGSIAFFTNTSQTFFAQYSWDFGDGTTSSAQSPSHVYAGTGTFNVCLVVSTGGCTDTFCAPITISPSNPNCFADFMWTQNPASSTVHFVDSSFTGTGAGPAYWYWSFGDGTGSQQQNPSHSYNAPGQYLVCLTIADSNWACSDTICHWITVQGTGGGNCSATFSSNNLQGPTYQFTPNSPGFFSSYSWDFGDGDSSHLQSPIHSYTSNGTFLVCLTVVDSVNNCTTTWCDSVVVGAGAGCHALFGYQAQGTTVFFYNNSSSGPGASYLWDLGDGNTSTGVNPTHTYSSAGTYTVCLALTDSSGCADSVCHVVVVQNAQGCVADFQWFPMPNGGIQFLNLSTGSSPISPLHYYWTFGDSSSSTLENPLHAYAQPDTYQVCLVIFDSLGSCSDTVCHWVVSPGNNLPCDANFAWVNTGNLVVGFTSLYPSPHYSYSWTFGDSGTANIAAPVHHYTAAGNYQVCLTVTDSVAGCTATYCDSIHVGNSGGAMCQADFSWLQTPGSTVFNFLDLSVVLGPNGQITQPSSYFWDFGDSSYAYVANPTHSFTSPGPWMVCLTIVDSVNNCTSTFCHTIMSNPNGYTISGSVMADTNNFIYNGVVYLIEHDSAAGTLTAIDSTYIGQSYYHFLHVQPGSYLVKAALLPASPDYANYLPTYLGDVLFWNNATSVIVTNSNQILPAITLVAGTNPGGPGFIGGLISQGANKTGEPIGNVSVLLLDDQYMAVTHTVSDNTGNYAFDQLAYGTYKIYVEIPGKMGSFATVTIDGSTPSVSDIDFEVNALDITTGIDVFSFGELLSVYPNPVSDQLYIALDLKEFTALDIRLYNTMGQVVLQQKTDVITGLQTLQLATGQLRQGAYLLDLRAGDQRLTRRIIKR